MNSSHEEGEYDETNDPTTFEKYIHQACLDRGMQILMHEVKFAARAAR
jgi:hypothetical protein